MSRAKSTAFLGVAVIAFTMLVGSATRSPAAPAPADGEKKADAAAFEVYKDKAGEYRWRLRAQNTKVLATSSEGYAEKRSCLAVRRAGSQSDAPASR